MFTPIVADDWRGALPASGAHAVDVVRAYHERTKHRPEAYSRGPETLDWDSGPAPFRRFEGAPIISLPRLHEHPELELGGARSSRRPPRARALTPETLGAFFEHALGITAWKSRGPDRWAVRVNPSSGNLHPVEGYLLARNVAGFEDGVHHYQPEDHALAGRASWAPDATEQAPRAWIALTTIPWREAWKYGERAFRYCQLDTGHAIAAFERAAALFGWTVREQPHVGTETLAQTLGTSRSEDYPIVRFAETEREECEVLLELTAGTPQPPIEAKTLRRWSAAARFHGRATPIDPRPMYSWPILWDVARATRSRDEFPSLSERSAGALGPASERTSAATIRGRRSARRFDPDFALDPDAFSRLLTPLSEALHADARRTRGEPSLELVLFVHRVQSLVPGVYLAPTNGHEGSALTRVLSQRFELPRVRGKVRGALGALELLELATAPPRELMRATRRLHCHQDIAATCSFSVAMVANLDAALLGGSNVYRRLHRQAGRLGHALYLGAEAERLGGTGIGCFFDDEVLSFVGLAGTGLAPLYHFAVGMPVEDAGTTTEPFEPNRHRSASPDTHSKES